MQRPPLQPHHPTAAGDKSLLGLELLRFACAISVLLWHYNHFYVVGAAHQGFSVRAQPLYGLLKPFYEAGWLGVQVFWALSGFIFFWKYAQPVQRGEVSAWRFAVLRFSRLYPLHIATLLAVAAMAWWYRQQHGVDYVYQFNDWPHFALQLLLASDWPGRSEWSFNGPIWSVSIEVLVYGLFFALCRLGLTRWWQVLGIIGVAGAVYASKRTEHPIVLCVFFFYLGALTHLAHEALGRLGPRLQQALLAAGVLLLVAGTAVTALGALRPMFYTALLAPLAMLLLLRWVRPASPSVSGLIATLGNTTYASYLLHFPLQLLVANLSGGQPERLPLASPAWLLGYLALTFGLAVWVFRRFEVPTQAALRARLLTAPARPSLPRG
ncbi:peptidoglycan/LPS O-acetylase OafA/YrhL [Aquabacterium commune]|uniref:Peptidoglycan/LPS O-acetylase OafA/YrhL n=2 Tax=Aquabacterium commune TaxID=70586 RepID=A0A4R6RAI8_9BURK|nr:peptidoglycan/LPS O-acetylase OafA/YrhL [Aquabacterium commune]